MVHGNFNMENITFSPQNVPTLGHLFPKTSCAKNSWTVHCPFFLVAKWWKFMTKKKPCLETQVCVFFTIQNYMKLWNSAKCEIDVIMIFYYILFKMYIWIYCLSPDIFEIRVMSLQLKLKALQNQWKV